MLMKLIKEQYNLALIREVASCVKFELAGPISGRGTLQAAIEIPERIIETIMQQ